MKNDDNLLIKMLEEEWNLMEASVRSLERSIEKCKIIGVKTEYSFEEQESFDSLTSKFSRTSDIFTQKIIRTVWMLLHESFEPFIDLANKCEKMHIVHSASELISIRDIRNQIAHEYLPDALRDLVPEVLEMSVKLIENIKYCHDFTIKREWV